jgi:hypothetical protein
MKFLYVKLLFAISTCLIFLGCDKLSHEKSDVMRFDTKILSTGTRIHWTDTVFYPYKTAELSKYESSKERANIDQFTITKIEFRLYNFRKDTATNKLTGNFKFKTQLGTTFNITSFDVGNEYKDANKHQVKSISTGSLTGAAAYDALAKELVKSDYEYIFTDEMILSPGKLDCDVSIYFYFTIKTKS